ncbi:MAG: transporter [Clostridia bacterium]|jgi:tungstate transport system ATP-binding protein|nr:transporter [Clostridia bacterium]
MNITLNHITKKYGDKTVLNIEQFDIKAGIVTGIIGPNGSGKSTLMKIIAGLDNEYTGALLIEGQKINNEIYKAMTLVFQKPYLINTDVYNNIAYPLKLRNIAADEIKSKTEKMIELLQLQEIMHQNARTLSGGEMQKVALARAIVFEPKLLLLDEPTSNIDPQTMQLMENAIRYINHINHTTVVLVTHNIRQLHRVCSQAVFMQEGKVAEQGSVSEILAKVNEDYTGDFLEQELSTKIK